MSRTARTLVAALIFGFVGNAAAQHVPHVNVRARWGGRLVPVLADGCPVEPADKSIAGLVAQCAAFHAEARTGDRKHRQQFASLAKDCDAKYFELYLSLLQNKYRFADFATVANELASTGSGGARLECELAASHNERLNDAIEREQARWDALEREHNARVDANNAEIARLRGELARPSSPPGPSASQVLGLMLQGMGRGLAGANTPEPSPSPANRGSVPLPELSAPPARAGCTSDFECQYGSACVKAPSAFEGYCAQKVNPYGTPTYSAPSPDSVMPGGPGQCSFDTDCPVGFGCAIELGSIRGACLKR